VRVCEERASIITVRRIEDLLVIVPPLGVQQEPPPSIECLLPA
jgi:hypothetical protein